MAIGLNTYTTASILSVVCESSQLVLPDIALRSHPYIIFIIYKHILRIRG